MRRRAYVAFGLEWLLPIRAALPTGSRHATTQLGVRFLAKTLSRVSIEYDGFEPARTAAGQRCSRLASGASEHRVDRQ